MDFFEAQERARRRSRWLVLWYATAVLGVVASYCALAAFGYWLVRQGPMPLAGAAVLRLGWQAPLARETLTTAKVSEALERLRHLAPFEKPALLKACVEAAAADGVFGLPEVEMLRMVAATLDCPVPPALAA